MTPKARTYLVCIVHDFIVLAEKCRLFQFRTFFLFRSPHFARNELGILSVAIFCRYAHFTPGGAGPPIFIATNKNAFSTNAQSRFASVALDGALRPLRLARHTWKCPCFSVVPKQRTCRGWAQKALQGSETKTKELLEKRKRKVFPHTRDHWFACRANYDF